jgi:hypothetical protein
MDPLTASLLIGLVFGVPTILIAVVSALTARASIR